MEINLQTKIKVLQKMFEGGITDDKTMKAFSLEDLANLKEPVKPNEIPIVIEIKQAVNKGGLFSYLAKEYRKSDNSDVEQDVPEDRDK